MMPGLLEGQEKMSKSDPNSAIFMEDSEAEVSTKIKKAFCPPKVRALCAWWSCARARAQALSSPCPVRCTRAPPQVVAGNPCLEYVRLVALPWFKVFEVKRPENFGGDKAYTSMEELEADYESGVLHPGECWAGVRWRSPSQPLRALTVNARPPLSTFAGDLKPALARAINLILQPVRDHFANDPEAKELLKKVRGPAACDLALGRGAAIACHTLGAEPCRRCAPTKSRSDAGTAKHSGPLA